MMYIVRIAFVLVALGLCPHDVVFGGATVAVSQQLFEQNHATVQQIYFYVPVYFQPGAQEVQRCLSKL
jgi:hypothetical protein